MSAHPSPGHRSGLSLRVPEGLRCLPSTSNPRMGVFNSFPPPRGNTALPIEGTERRQRRVTQFPRRERGRGAGEPFGDNGES